MVGEVARFRLWPLYTHGDRGSGNTRAANNLRVWRRSAGRRGSSWNSAHSWHGVEETSVSWVTRHTQSLHNARHGWRYAHQHPHPEQHSIDLHLRWTYRESSRRSTGTGMAHHAVDPSSEVAGGSAGQGRRIRLPIALVLPWFGFAMNPRRPPELRDLIDRSSERTPTSERDRLPHTTRLAAPDCCHLSPALNPAPETVSRRAVQYGEPPGSGAALGPPSASGSARLWRRAVARELPVRAAGR